MRLTLRTLLAWIDGLLPEADHAALTAKVEASPVAPRLVTRIADVVARPGLPAPSDDGPAGDANTAAAFLDNELPVEQLEAFERICLESDIHLAEVADCHAALAELTRDPGIAAALDPMMRSRLIEIVVRETGDEPASSRHEDLVALGAIMRDAKAAATPSVFKRRTRASFGAWFSVAAAIALVAVLGALLLRQVWPAPDPGRQVAVTDRHAADDADAPPATDPPVASRSDAPDPAATPSSDDAPEVSPPTEPPAEPALDASVDELPREPSDDEATAFPEAGAGAGVMIPLPVMETRDPPVAEPEPDHDPAPPEVAPVQPPGIVHVVSAGGPLLRRVTHGDDPGWRAVFAGAPLGDGEDLIVPVHVYPQLVRGDVSIRLMPGTRCATTVDHDGTPRFEIVFGRAVVWTEAADARVGITAGGLSGVFTLGPRQPAGVDVELTRDSGSDPAIVPPGRRATLFSGGGGRWRQTETDGGPPGVPLAGIPIEQPLPPRGGLLWDSSAAGAVRILPPSAEPAWMRLTGPTQPVDRLAAGALGKALAADVPADEALGIMAAGRRIEDRMAATATLALMGSYSALVEALCEESPARRLREGEWTALEASAVPLALARGANAAAALRQAFEARGPAGRGAEIFLLARGLSPDELARGGLKGLVASLEDASLVIRRYALANLVGLLPDPAEATRDYRPDRSPRLNDKGLVWWRERLAEGPASPVADDEEGP
jgi:hypothetical protein